MLVVYGSDAGLVSEIAETAAHSLSRQETPPGEILRIEDADLEGDPDKLFIELQTLPMFSGAKVIRTSIGRRVNANQLKQVFDTGPPAAALVVEAGNLKPSDMLRKLAEATSWAAALPCYADSAKDLSRIVDETVAEAGKRIAPDVRELLVSRLGADRALSRREVEKLIIYAGDSSDIREQDVLAVVGDVSELSLDRVTVSAGDGRAREAIEAAERATAAGQTYQAVLLALQRYFLMLHALASAIDSGKRLDDAIRTVRPPLAFGLRDAVTRQLRSCHPGTLGAAVSRIQATIRNSRGPGAANEAAATERLIMDLAHLMKRKS